MFSVYIVDKGDKKEHPWTLFQLVTLILNV